MCFMPVSKKRRALQRLGVLSLIGAIAAVSSAQTPRGALVDLLVFGPDVTSVDLKAYSPEIREQIDDYVRRYQSYQSTRVRPESGVLKMVPAAQVRYERRLAAVSDDPRAAAIAPAYVDRLRPCYEWEGFHDCPEREAQFARDYRAANPTGPFSDYLPLLEAHRWLCAAEGYEYEERPQDAARSRKAFLTAVSRARSSAVLLVRTAADELAARARCFSRQP